MKPWMQCGLLRGLLTKRLLLAPALPQTNYRRVCVCFFFVSDIARTAAKDSELLCIPGNKCSIKQAHTRTHILASDATMLPFVLRPFVR